MASLSPTEKKLVRKISSLIVKYQHKLNGSTLVTIIYSSIDAALTSTLRNTSDVEMRREIIKQVLSIANSNQIALMEIAKTYGEADAPTV